MNPLDFLNPYKWLLYGGLVLSVVLGIFAWHERGIYKAVQAERAKIEAQWLKERAAADDARRAKEQQLQGKVATIDRNLQAEKARRAAADRATTNALRLLNDAVAPGPGATGKDSTPTSGVTDPRNAIIGECGGALDRLGKENRELAAIAAGLQKYTTEVCLKAAE